MKKRSLLALFTLLFFTGFAQVTFQQYPVPARTDNPNYRLVADYYSDKKILIPVLHSDSVFAQNTTGGSFNLVGQGLYVTAFYANNGDLYLVENTDTNSFNPHLYKSVNNGSTFTEITGVAGRVFQRDQDGNLFYSITGGFAFSTDDGANFTNVSTPDTVFSVARSAEGTLYMLSDSVKLYFSTNNGTNWTDLSKKYSGNAWHEQHLWALNDKIYFQTGSSLHFTTENDTIWHVITLPFTSIITSLHVSPDLASFCTSAYGFFTSNNLSNGATWTNIRTVPGPAQVSIYNNYIAATDSAMYWHTETGYIYAPRTPNPVNIAAPQLNNTNVKVFPNPATAQLFVSSCHKSDDFLLLNVTGQTVLTERVSSPGKAIDLKGLKPGIYVWRMGISTGKIILQ
jgi:hypothetical protein